MVLQPPLSSLHLLNKVVRRILLPGFVAACILVIQNYGHHDSDTLSTVSNRMDHAAPDGPGHGVSGPGLLVPMGSRRFGSRLSAADRTDRADWLAVPTGWKSRWMVREYGCVMASGGSGSTCPLTSLDVKVIRTIWYYGLGIRDAERHALAIFTARRRSVALSRRKGKARDDRDTGATTPETGSGGPLSPIEEQAVSLNGWASRLSVQGQWPRFTEVTVFPMIVPRKT